MDQKEKNEFAYNAMLESILKNYDGISGFAERAGEFLWKDGDPRNLTHDMISLMFLCAALFEQKLAEAAPNAPEGAIESIKYSLTKIFNDVVVEQKHKDMNPGDSPEYFKKKVEA